MRSQGHELGYTPNIRLIGFGPHHAIGVFFWLVGTLYGIGFLVNGHQFFHLGRGYASCSLSFVSFSMLHGTNSGTTSQARGELGACKDHLCRLARKGSRDAEDTVGSNEL